MSPISFPTGIRGECLESIWSWKQLETEILWHEEWGLAEVFWKTQNSVSCINWFNVTDVSPIYVSPIYGRQGSTQIENLYSARIVTQECHNCHPGRVAPKVTDQGKCLGKLEHKNKCDIKMFKNHTNFCSGNICPYYKILWIKYSGLKWKGFER